MRKQVGVKRPTYCTSMEYRMRKTLKGRQMKINVKKEVEGGWATTRTDVPFTSWSLSAAITMTHK